MRKCLVLVHILVGCIYGGLVAHLLRRELLFGLRSLMILLLIQNSFLI